MIIILLLVALVAGASAAILLWPYGVAVALLAAPFVSSAVVLVTAIMLVPKSAEAPADRGVASHLLYALSKLLTR